MSITARAVAMTTSLLPVDQARQALLPPVRLMRYGAVAVARTVRHWELVLADEDSDGESVEWRPDSDASDTQRRDRDASVRPASKADTPSPAEMSAAELPVQDWPELSYADAQSRLVECDDDDLRTLLEYEQTHGHRLQYTLLLEQRLASGM